MSAAIEIAYLASGVFSVAGSKLLQCLEDGAGRKFMTQKAESDVVGKIPARSVRSIKEVLAGPAGTYFLPRSKLAMMFKSPLTGSLRFIQLRSPIKNENDLPAIVIGDSLTIRPHVERHACEEVVVEGGEFLVRPCSRAASCTIKQGKGL